MARTVKHNKLVRDNLPAVIVQQGGRPVVEQLDLADFKHELKKKLHEIAGEIYNEGRIDDLIEILEIVYTLAALAGVNETQLDELRNQKLVERGGYNQRLLLVETSYD
ncbi:MAG: nucleoside triphosphate pyrophosphohydrolase [Anaerolineae bacterium]